MLGIVVAGDLITLYVFFEWLGLAAYLFVVHVGAAAERAGLKYLVLTLLGGFAVLTGVLLAHALGGGESAGRWRSIPGRETMRLAAAVLPDRRLRREGRRARPAHLAARRAHGRARARERAAVGVMIKAGAYGILRTVPPRSAPARRGRRRRVPGRCDRAGGAGVGYGDDVAGVVMALWQFEAKRLLAYSSVSQMGFILVGIGARPPTSATTAASAGPARCCTS
jgi:formate hydrogenlyase subunit 3/multisubunit Na+/H+ antiporter MnhD subunit